MVIWDTSPPSSGSAGFPNKVTIPYPNNYVGLSCGEQYKLGLVTKKIIYKPRKEASEEINLAETLILDF